MAMNTKTKEEIEQTLYSIGMKLERKLRKTDLPITELGIPSYNTCMRKGVSLRAINDHITYDLFKNDSPTCKHCDEFLSFEQRYNVFCSHSCSASHNNNGVVRNGYSTSGKNCIECGEKLNRNAAKYCGQGCKSKHENSKRISQWLNGELSGVSGKAKQTKRFVRKYIFDLRGTACSWCGWDEVHPDDGLPLTQLDHIDGDADNTTPENLRVLCPNCHSMTSTYLRRNKQSCRDRR